MATPDEAHPLDQGIVLYGQVSDRRGRIGREVEHSCYRLGNRSYDALADSLEKPAGPSGLGPFHRLGYDAGEASHHPSHQSLVTSI